MQEAVITDIAVQPEFELEDFMFFSKETRLDNETLMHLIEYWENWVAAFQVRQIASGDKSWLAVWLPEKVENELEEAWNESPSKGFLLNSLAQYLCMNVVEALLPQAANGGCAPKPESDEDLRNALEELGLVNGSGELERRYAIVSYYPFKGGCEICSLRDSCPKGEEKTASIVLRGHER